MTENALITQLVQAAKGELGRRKPSDELFEYGHIVAQQGATPDLIRQFVAELRRDVPDDKATRAFSILLTLALTHLSLDANGGRSAARRALEDVRAVLAAEITQDPLPSDGLMVIARCYSDAECDPGSVFKEALQVAAAERPADNDFSPAALAALFHQLAAMMDHDPVAIHGEILAITDAMPPEMRATLATAMATSKIPSVVAASLGFVLDANDATAIDTLIALGMSGSTARPSSQTVDRLVRMRPWLRPIRHNQLDTAVGALRKRALPAAPAKPSSIYRIVAALPDGSGAASIFAATRAGGKFTLNMVLLKANQGVVDGLVDRGMTRRAIDTKFTEIGQNVDIVPISSAFALKMVSHALSESLVGARALPLALLEVIENLGLGHVPLVASPPAALAAELLAGLPPDRIDEAAGAAAAATSGDWQHTIPCVRTWFEAGEAVDARLGNLRGRGARYTAIIDEILPTRRVFWAGRCAWLAASLREWGQDEKWIDVALVARSLAAGVPLGSIGLMSEIAIITAAAFEANNPEPPAARQRSQTKAKARRI